MTRMINDKRPTNRGQLIPENSSGLSNYLSNTTISADCGLHQSSVAGRVLIPIIIIVIFVLVAIILDIR